MDFERPFLSRVTKIEQLVGIMGKLHVWSALLCFAKNVLKENFK